MEIMAMVVLLIWAALGVLWFIYTFKMCQIFHKYIKMFEPMIELSQKQMEILVAEMNEDFENLKE